MDQLFISSKKNIHFRKSAFAKPTISPLCGHSDHKGMAVELPYLGVSGHLGGHIPVVPFELSEQELLSLYPTHGPLIPMVLYAQCSQHHRRSVSGVWT